MSRRESSWFEIREGRLRADFEKVLQLTRDNELIHLESWEDDPPETYLIRYTCLGVVAPGDDHPILSAEHRVEISFPIEYPTRPPQLRWLTPIFHPNINREGTGVCIDIWYPSKFLDDLCVMLGRMIQYQNYNPNPYHCLRVDAALWAKNSPHLLPVDRRPLRRGESPAQEFDIKLL